MKVAEGSISVLCLPGRSTIALEVNDDHEIAPAKATAQLTVQQARDLIRFLEAAVFVYDTDVFGKAEEQIFANQEGK